MFLANILKTNTLQKECSQDSDCGDHGLCQEDATCGCQLPWIQDVEEQCKECQEEGFFLSDDGIRCVNINSCTNQAAGDLTECSNNHGFCEQKQSNNNSDDNFFCRCRKHYSNETTSGLKKEPSYCSVCQKSHYETEDKSQCIPQECINNFNKKDTKNVTSCSDYGLCVDLTDGELVHDEIVDVIINVVNKLLDDLNIPLDLNASQCVCKTPHMTATCNECAPGYIMTKQEEGSFIDRKCYQNTCDQFDENYNVLVSNCNNVGECYLNGSNVYVCNCSQDNYNSSTQCTTCEYNFDQNTQCTECLPGWDVKALCSTCLFGFEIESQCTQCEQGYQMTDDGLCNTCEHNMDPLTRCTVCPEGLSTNSNGDCVMQNTSSDTTAIVFGCIIGVIVLIILIWVLVKYLQKKRASKIDYSKIEGAQEDELEKIDPEQVEKQEQDIEQQ